MGVRCRRRARRRWGKKGEEQEKDQNPTEEPEPTRRPKPSEDQKNEAAAGAKPIVIDDPTIKKLFHAGHMGQSPQAAEPLRKLMRDGKQIRPLLMPVIPEEPSDASLVGNSSARPSGRLPIHQMLRAPNKSGAYPQPYDDDLADHDAQIVRTLAA